MNYTFTFLHKNLFPCLFGVLFLGLIFSSCDPTKNLGNDSLDKVVVKKDSTKETPPDVVVTPPKVIEPTKIDTVRWCDTLQRDPSTLVIVCFEKIGNGTIKADTVDVIEIYNSSNSTDWSNAFLDSAITKKAAYRVAIIMPFRSKSFSAAPSREIPGHSLKSIEFYEGVQIALDSLKKEGVSLFVDVFDSMGDTTTVRTILQKPELKQADLIIGPISSRTLTMVAEFAKTYQTPLVSPFNPRPDLTTNNPYYIQVNPSFTVYSKTIIENLYQIEQENRYRQLDKKVLLLGENSDSLEIQQLQKNFAIYTNTFDTLLPQYLSSSASVKINYIRPLLDKSKLNIIVIPSSNEEFIYNCLRELQSLVDKIDPNKGYQIVVVGQDRWKYYSRITFEYYESLNLHFPAEFYVNKSISKNINFRNGYKNNYGIAPREFGYIGFDVMLYFGRMLHNYGTNFQMHFWKSPAHLRHTEFRFQPVYENVVPLDSRLVTPRPVIRGFENQYLHFLQFKDYTIQTAK